MSDITLSTVIAPDHMLSPPTRKGVLAYATEHLWMVGISDPVKWEFETIGHKRLNELYKVKTKWVFCLDSDDELLGPFPPNMSVFEDRDFLLFWSIRHDGEQKKMIKGRGWTQSATARVLFKTEFLIPILEMFVKTNLVREDLFMMWQALETGKMAYIPRFILKKHGTRCSADAWFRRRAKIEPSHWKMVFSAEATDRYNKIIRESVVKA